MKKQHWQRAHRALAVIALATATAVQTQSGASAAAPVTASKNLAPGFTARPAASRLVIVPVDIELFSISGGGVLEPRADWTELATRHFRASLNARKIALGQQVSDLGDKDMDELDELNALHGALAQSISLHHFGGIALPTKNGVLDWSLGDAVAALKTRTGADYALFTWVRDSYASSERKAAMIALALVGVGVGGGVQIGYASLVDLNTGRVVWFNRMFRANGDLRDEKSALETVETLLTGFPVAK